MSRRHVNKARARERRMLRRDLVHACGCTFRSAPCVCLYRDVLPEILTEAVALGVRIPRSLRRLAKGQG